MMEKRFEQRGIVAACRRLRRVRIPFRCGAFAAFCAFAVSSTGMMAPTVAAATASPSPVTRPLSQADAFPTDRRAAIEQNLKHLYAVYLGIRSCSEISAMQKDRAFLPEVSLDEARASLRGVDAATREIGLDPVRIWNEEAPDGSMTAEALKTNPETHLKFCQRMGSLFRMDASRLQALLSELGAKSPIIMKDY